MFKDIVPSVDVKQKNLLMQMLLHVVGHENIVIGQHDDAQNDDAQHNDVHK